MIFREIYQDEAEQAIEIESICFPPNEACSAESMRERIQEAPELFLIAYDEEQGIIAGFLNGVSTEESSFRDEFFTDISLYNPQGTRVMLLGLDVRPEYRGRGLAKEIVQRYEEMARSLGKTELVLTCLEEKVGMYRKMNFQDLGIANSRWGGEQWHEMKRDLKDVGRA